ncbi:MAG: hypothetical protein AB1486_33335 [Planctomycetota bacterium]
MRASWSAVLVTLITTSPLLRSTEGQAAGELDLQIELRDAGQMVAPGAVYPGELTFVLRRQAPGRTTGQLVITPPPQAVVDGSTSFPFELGTGEWRLPFHVALPASSRRHDFLVEVFCDTPGGLPVARPEAAILTDLSLVVAPRWWVIGPFDSARGKGFDTPYPPEKSRDLKLLCKGLRGRPAAFEPLPGEALRDDGFVDLTRVFEPHVWVTAYAMCRVSVPAETPARLLLGSDDSITAWISHRKVHAWNGYRIAAPGEDTVPVTLPSGESWLLLKIGQGDGGWGFYADIDAGQGKSPEGLRWEMGLTRVLETDPRVEIRSCRSQSAEIAWRTPEPSPAKLILTPAVNGRVKPIVGVANPSAMLSPRPGGRRLSARCDRLSTRHVVTVEGLEPSCRYTIQLDPAAETPQPLRAFTTEPLQGRMLYLHLRLVALLFTNVTEAPSSDEPGANEPAPREEITRVLREMQAVTLFYWINSGMRLFLDVTYLEDPTPQVVAPDTPYGIGSSGEATARLQAVLAERGLEPGDFDGALFVSFDRHFAEGRWHYPPSGGGTYGPLPPFNIGSSAWKSGSHNGWLFCHEFHHQLDALFHASGWPDYLFNHFQPWDGTAHRHGEHWDGNAWILREWAGHVTREQPFGPRPGRLGFRYLTSLWGEVAEATDRDGDNFPDAAPQLPLDERRFGSSLARVDSDGDGLDDLAEAMACEWVDYGLDEVWAGPPERHRAKPTEPDSDGDGLVDGEDPYPLYPFKPQVESGPVTVNGKCEADEWQHFARFEDELFKGDFYLRWDESRFAIAFEGERAPMRMHILLDLDDDGWFCGSDNYDIWIQPGGGRHAEDAFHATGAGTFAIALHNAGVTGRWPFYDAAAFAGGLPQYAQSLDATYTFELALPRSEAHGLELEAGERIGLLIAIDPGESHPRPGQAGLLTLFEPHTFFAVELSE